MPKKIKKDIPEISSKTNTKKIINTLGIDLSIGKIKICLLSLDKEEKRIGGGWSTLPVDFEFIGEKHYEFSKGFAIAIDAFLKHHRISASEINSIIFCTGGGYYMFKTFADGMRYAGGVLKMLFPKQKVYFIRNDGELININDIFELDDKEGAAFGCTNYLGTTLLARKTFTDGLAIDMGTISTSIIPVIDGKIDPVASYNPAGYMHHRYSTGKHIWYGVMHTQLIYITHQARTKRANYNLILRSCSTNTLCSLLNLIEPQIANVHVLEHSQISEKDIAFIKMAETVGLDINSISQEELLEIAKDIYFQCIYKLSEIIRNILTNMNYKNFGDLRVLAAGLGQQAFIIPALMGCGFEKSQIMTVTEDKDSNLWTATSVYGLALLALEKITGEEINVSMETLAPEF